MRETQKYTIDDGGNQLTIVIKPMGAVAAERWMTKALFVLGAGAAQTLARGDIEAIASALSAVDYDKAAELWDSLLKGVQIELDGGALIELNPSTLDAKINLPTTLILIKIFALKANFGFFTGEGGKTFLGQMRGALMSQKSTVQQVSQTYLKSVGA